MEPKSPRIPIHLLPLAPDSSRTLGMSLCPHQSSESQDPPAPSHSHLPVDKSEGNLIPNPSSMDAKNSTAQSCSQTPGNLWDAAHSLHPTLDWNPGSDHPPHPGKVLTSRKEKVGWDERKWERKYDHGSGQGWVVPKEQQGKVPASPKAKSELGITGK